MKIFKITLFASLILAVLGAAQTVYVPVRHWVYDYIDRMETKRHIPVVLNGTKPLTRSEISGYLQQLENVRDKLSNTELEQLDYLLFEFQDTSAKNKKLANYETRLKKITQQPWIDSWLPDFVYPTGRHLLEIEHGPLRLNWDPLFYRSCVFADDDTLSSQERVFTDTNGFLLWGTIGPWFGFYTDVRDTREWGTRRYPAGNTTVEGYGFVQGNGEHIYHDETVAYLLFQKNYVSLQFGKDSNVWGPAAHGHMFLSNTATSYDQFKLQLNLPRLKYSYLLAWLKHYTPNYFKGDPTTKFFAAHRLEFSPHNKIDLGLHSGVIYSERFEPAYLNPVMFFRSAEHYLGDTDNAVMGVDVEVKPVRNFKMYGELFLDDLTTSKLGSGFYGNKYGYTLGGFYTGLFGVSDFDLRIEYSKMRPYVYSHKDTVTSYAHFSTALGHWMGANSDLSNLTLRYQLSRRLRIEANVNYYRYGANTEDLNVGRGLFRPRDYRSDPENIEMLDGTLHERLEVGVSGQYEFIRNGFVHLAYSYAQTEIDKESTWDYPVARSQIEFGFSLNY